MVYVEIDITKLSEGGKSYLENLSRQRLILQDRTTVRKSLDETKLIGRAFEDMVAMIPSSVLLRVMTKEEAMAYVSNPANGYSLEGQDE